MIKLLVHNSDGDNVNLWRSFDTIFISRSGR